MGTGRPGTGRAFHIIACKKVQGYLGKRGKPAGQCADLFFTVIDSGEKKIVDADPPPSPPGEFRPGIRQRAPQAVIIRGMGEKGPVDTGSTAVQRQHQAIMGKMQAFDEICQRVSGGGKGNRHATGMIFGDKGADRREIGQRLANAGQGNPLYGKSRFLDDMALQIKFIKGEITIETMPARCAEDAAHGTADLG